MAQETTYKLYYFDLKGLGEPIRMLFAYGGINYEDVRYSLEEWPEIKPTMPLGQMPVLEIDGERVYQASAIYRYVSKKVGLAGSDDWENLQIDMMVDTLRDLLTKFTTVKYEPDEELKATKLVDLKENIAPYYFSKLDCIAEENDGHLALGRLTFADVILTGFEGIFNHLLDVEFTETYPNLKSVIDNVSSVDSIKTWIEARPNNPY